MFVRVNLHFGLALSPKAASSSITNALPLPWSEVSVGTFLELPTRIMFMREPHDRMVSAYRMFSPKCSFEKFVINVCRDDGGNSHLVQQSTLCLPGQPTRIIRWDFDELSNVLGVPIPHDNPCDASFDVEWSDTALDVFASAYADDLKLYRGEQSS